MWGTLTTDFGNTANLVTLGVSRLHFVALQLLQSWGWRRAVIMGAEDETEAVERAGGSGEDGRLLEVL